MRAYQLDGFGLQHLKEVERRAPAPGPGEILIRIEACSLNYRDLLILEGSYNPNLSLPVVPVSDGAGVVAAVGEGVSRFRAGDRVMPICAVGWISGPPNRSTLKATLGGPLDGTLQELLAVPEHSAVRIPAHLSFEEAAALPCAALTAWNALVTHGGARRGDAVLIQGTGGVATFALQLAGILGLRSIVISSSDEKLARARELGATHTINYVDRPSWDREALDLTQGEGVEHLVEVGGAETFARSCRATRPGGAIYLIGVLSGRRGDLDLTPIVMRNIRIQGILMGSRDSFEELNHAVELHALRPVIDHISPFSAARDAYEHLKSGRHLGKVVIRL